MISQKYNTKKNNEVFFYSYEGWENDISSSVNIISFHHTFINKEYILSNIIKEGKYMISFIKLYENSNFKRVIDNIVDIDIDEYIYG